MNSVPGPVRKEIRNDLARCLHGAGRTDGLLRQHHRPNRRCGHSERVPAASARHGHRSIGNLIGFLAARVAVLVRVATLAKLAKATSRYVQSSSTGAITRRNQVSGLLDAEMTRLASWYDDEDYTRAQSP